MSTIYWIEMLDGIFYFIVSIYAALFIGSLVLFISAGPDGDPKLFRYSRICLFTGITLALTSIFIPTTSQAYRIWGIGGTIEYLKNNKDAKQLPDRTLKILNKWADSYLEEDSTNINK